MAAARTMDVESNTDLDRLLDEAGERPVVLIKSGVRYRVTREAREAVVSDEQSDDPWAIYDPERLMEGVRAAAGSITEEEAVRMKAYIYAAREAGTRPPDRP